MNTTRVKKAWIVLFVFCCFGIGASIGIISQGHVALGLVCLIWNLASALNAWRNIHV